eukprot:evm.model.scf_940.1 EVM.evm.TU.scf_940.1   scf_940:7095-14522(-)
MPCMRVPLPRESSPTAFGGLIPLSWRPTSERAARRRVASRPAARGGGRCETMSNVDAGSNSGRPCPVLRAQAVEGTVAADSESHPREGAAQEECRTVFEMWSRNARRLGDVAAVLDLNRSQVVRMNYRELEEEITSFAAGLRSIGLAMGDKVSLISENSGRWIVADQGILMNGAIDAVRGSSAPTEELMHIIRDSQSIGIVIQDAETLKRLIPHLATKYENGRGYPGNETVEITSRLEFIVVLWGTMAGIDPSILDCTVLTYDEVVRRGLELKASQSFRLAHCKESDVATLVYTSGTTGRAKGVKLTHGNLMYQVTNFSYFVDVQPGNKVLSLLPPWHIYERSVSYFVFSRGGSQVYSTVATLKRDLAQHQPDYFVCVPLILDTLYSKVMSQLRKSSVVRRFIALWLLFLSTAFVRAQRVVQGVAVEHARAPRPLASLFIAVLLTIFLRPLHWIANILVHRKLRSAIGVGKVMVSGGASLASNLDDFFEAIGLTVVHGYGLTETSPVLTCRRAASLQNVRGTIGVPIPGTELRVVDPQSLQNLPDGSPGLLLAKGPGVMEGYHRNEEETSKAFTDGREWLRTGDIGWRAPTGVNGSLMAGHFVITGRLKDTIVLSNGENVEPQPIEDWLTSSPLIKQVMLVGQNQRSVGALVVPNWELIMENMDATGGSLVAKDVHSAILREINVRQRQRPEYSPKDRIAAIRVLREPFSYEEGTLTRTMKLKRSSIAEIRRQDVDELLHHLR